jgi:hypothetical protein
MNTKHFKLPGRRRATTTEDLGVIRKFSIGSKPLSSFIAHFDDSNSGYVPQEGGNDPVGGMPGDITGANVNPARSVPDDNELEFLAGLAGLHQSIIDKINLPSTGTDQPAQSGRFPGPRRQGQGVIYFHDCQKIRSASTDGRSHTGRNKAI